MSGRRADVTHHVARDQEAPDVRRGIRHGGRGHGAPQGHVARDHLPHVVTRAGVPADDALLHVPVEGGADVVHAQADLGAPGHPDHARIETTAEAAATGAGLVEVAEVVDVHRIDRQDLVARGERRRVVRARVRKAAHELQARAGVEPQALAAGVARQHERAGPAEMHAGRDLATAPVDHLVGGVRAEGLAVDGAPQRIV